jgi:hypothetical protein
MIAFQRTNCPELYPAVNGGWPQAHSRPVCQEAIEQRSCRDLNYIYCDQSSEASNSSKGYCTCIVAGWQRYDCRSGTMQQLTRSIAQHKVTETFVRCLLWCLCAVPAVPGHARQTARSWTAGCTTCCTHTSSHPASCTKSTRRTKQPTSVLTVA